MQLIMRRIILQLVGEAHHAAGAIRLVKENLANLESALPEMTNIDTHRNLPIP